MSYDCHVVLDFEFNPVQKAYRGIIRSEILEIGAVKLNYRYEEIDRFSCLVKPEMNDYVEPAITKLTGIRTGETLSAESFQTAIEHFSAWVGTSRTRIYSWSENDLSQLKKECALKNVEFPSNFRRWMDIQKIYQRIIHYSARGHMALGRAADQLGIAYDTNEAHRALYDAVVTAEIVKLVTDSAFLIRQRNVHRAVITEHCRSTYSIGDACGSILASLMLRLPA